MSAYFVIHRVVCGGEVGKFPEPMFCRYQGTTVVMFLGVKFYMQIFNCMGGGSVPLTPVLFKGELYSFNRRIRYGSLFQSSCLMSVENRKTGLS